MNLPFGKKPQRPVPRRRLDASRQARNTALETQPAAPSQMFRRNQTLVGSRSRNVQSASELSTETTLRSPRATAHHLRAHRRKLSTYLIAGLMVCAGLFGLLYQMTDQVRVSLYGQVAPLPDADQQRLERYIEQYLHENPLQRLRFALNKEQLLAYLATHDAREIYQINELEHDGIGKTHLQLKAREPIASWAIGSDRRFVDADGVVFSKNYFDAPDVRIRDESGISVDNESAATAVTSTRFLQFIGQAVGAMNQQKIAVTSVNIPANTTRQVDVVVGKTRLMMTIDRAVGEQSEDGARAWRHLREKNRNPRYIDVRVGGRAYYR